MNAFRMGLRKTILIVLVFSTLLPGKVKAGAFAVLEQGVREMGTANAGMAALAETPSTIFFNPAGLTRLKGHQVQVVVNYFVPSIDYKDQGSSVYSATAAGPALLSGGDGGDAGGGTVAPNLYYSYKITDWFAAGLGLAAPFGVANAFDPGWKGRYYSLKTTIETLNITPTLAFGPFKFLSIGVGFTAQRLDAAISNAVDWGLIGAMAGQGTTPQSLDGRAKISGVSWGFGVNAGLLFEFSDSARVGLSYRSHIAHNMDGDAEFITPPAAVPLSLVLGQFDTTGSTDVALPEMVSLSAHYQVSDRVALMMDVTWTGWHRFDKLRVEFDSWARDYVMTMDWEDTFRYAVGLSFEPQEQWALRLGYAYDETPVPTAEARNPFMPDANRHWFALGTSYEFTEKVGTDFAFAYAMLGNFDSNRQTNPFNPLYEDNIRGNLIGKYEAEVTIVSLQFRLAL